MEGIRDKCGMAGKAKAEKRDSGKARVGDNQWKGDERGSESAGRKGETDMQAGRKEVRDNIGRDGRESQRGWQEWLVGGGSGGRVTGREKANLVSKLRSSLFLPL